MDMSGAMPRAAWFEIRDEAGELIAKVPGHISGGGISAELPTFPPGTLGTILLCTDHDGDIHCDEDVELGELPTTRSMRIVQIG